MAGYTPPKKYEDREEEFNQLVSDLETRIDEWRLHARAVDFKLRHHQLVSRFPRVLHQTWKNTEDFPAHFASSVRTCMALHPTWEYKFWSDSDNEELVERLYPQHADIFNDMAAIKRADIARLVILYEYGGAYLDFDVECARPLDELIFLSDELDIGCILGAENELHTVLLEDRQNPMVSNAMMIARPKHPFIRELIDYIFQKATWCGDDPVECTGPRILDSMSIKYEHANTGESAAKVVRLPYQYFSPRIARWNSGNMAKPCTRFQIKIKFLVFRFYNFCFRFPFSTTPKIWEVALTFEILIQSYFVFPKNKPGEQLQALHEEEQEDEGDDEIVYADDWVYKVSRERVEAMCEAGKIVQQYPGALENKRTYSRHLWQCSWCRDDPRLSRRLPLWTLWQNITSRPWTGRTSSPVSANYNDKFCDTMGECRQQADELFAESQHHL